MLQLEVLIGKLLPVDAQTSSTIAVGEVASLNHEVLDNTVELAVLVGESVSISLLVTFSQTLEVLYSLRNRSSEKTNNNSPSRFTTDFNVKVHLICHFGSLNFLSVTAKIGNS